jgi:hypothetical protein
VANRYSVLEKLMIYIYIYLIADVDAFYPSMPMGCVQYGTECDLPTKVNLIWDNEFYSCFAFVWTMFFETEN